MKKLLAFLAVAMLAGAPTYAGMKDKVKEKAGESVSVEEFSKEDITKFQNKLSEKGFFEGKADGKANEKLTAGVKKFQESKDMEATGKIDKATIDALDLDVDLKQAQKEAE